jgi:hypothetical protein
MSGTHIRSQARLPRWTVSLAGCGCVGPECQYSGTWKEDNRHTPVLGFALTTGIARAHDGTLYFLYASGTEDLTAADGLQNPTSVALRHGTAYVPSAAYPTATDPNLLLASLPHNR